MGESISSNVDDRTIHELYAFPFMDSLKAGAVSAMCSYQRTNNSYGCQNSKLLNGILKTELGFQGFVTSDWDAQHAGVASANAGLDLVMPDGGYWGDNLTEAVKNGSVAESRLDDMVTRILAAWYRLGQDSGYPRVNFGANVQANHAENVRACARDGTVLLRNEENVLPLSSPATIAVIGSSSVIGAHARNERVHAGDEGEEQHLRPYIVDDCGFEFFVIAPTSEERVRGDHGGLNDRRGSLMAIWGLLH